MTKKLIVRTNEYYDSIQLMRISEELRALGGVEQALVAMATVSNKQILAELGLGSEEADGASAGDLLVAFETREPEDVDRVLECFEELLKKRLASRQGKVIHRSLSGALRAMPDANLCVISVPGEYAYAEACRALDSGLHVLVYSDNVPLEQERRLKERALAKGLLCMGPDCGVTNLNGLALMTASVARKGTIGIVGASGSGTQQIAVLCDKSGEGVSQAIGVGGKDLTDEVGGLGMLQGIDLLEGDSETKVIVLVSRTPGATTLPKILGRVAHSSKPVICYFIGGDPALVEQAGALSAVDLEDAAMKAVAVARGQESGSSGLSLSRAETASIIAAETAAMAARQRYLRGLYCGGTFCEEAMSLLTEYLGETYSNAPLRSELKLADSMKSLEHTVIDLGDEEFTHGRPHPVIDPEPVRRALLREARDQEVAVYLMDFILGPAIHPDPAGAVVAEIVAAKRAFSETGGYLSVVASVCGTEGDPQRLSRQEAILRQAGVIVMPSNAQAARLAGMIAEKVRQQ